MPSAIHFVKPAPDIAFLELDHPPANTMSTAMKNLLEERLKHIAGDSSVRALIISGKGSRFCTGDDLKEAIARSHNHESIIANLAHFSRIFSLLEDLKIPTIAAINGWCIGGGLELALCCDIRICCPEAGFRGAGVRVGLTASGFRLPSIIGKGRAKHLLLTGNSIEAETALQYGLVSAIFPTKTLLDEAVKVAKSIASNAPLAVKATKAIINATDDHRVENVKAFAEKQIIKLAQSEDHQEALKAFGEKKSPIFKGI